MCLVQQAHGLLLSSCIVLLLACRCWCGRGRDASCESGRRCCRLGRLTWIRGSAPLVGQLRCSSHSPVTLQRRGTRTAGIMLELGPFPPCRLSLARLAAQAAARCMHSPDIHCRCVVSCRRDTATYSDTQSHGTQCQPPFSLNNVEHSTLLAVPHLLQQQMAVEERRVQWRQQWQQNAQQWSRQHSARAACWCAQRPVLRGGVTCCKRRDGTVAESRDC